VAVEKEGDDAIREECATEAQQQQPNNNNNNNNSGAGGAKRGGMDGLRGEHGVVCACKRFISSKLLTSEIEK